MHWLKRTRRRLAEEGGVTLVEMLVAGILAVALVGTLGYLFLIAQRNQPQVAERSFEIQDGRVKAESITREIREAYAIVGTPTSNSLSINTFVRHTSCGASSTLPANADSIACRVTYTCNEGTCTRVEANTNGTNPGPADILVEGLVSDAVFTTQTTPSGSTHIDVRLSFEGEDGDESVTISDGAELRNQ
jgi:Tfp pilus assembly protein PilW